MTLNSNHSPLNQSMRGDLTPAQQLVMELLASYTPSDDQQIAALRLFDDFAREQPMCCERELPVGHLTASVWLVNRTGTHVLLTHHKKLNCWLQLGGHADGDSDLRAVAMREAIEESSLSDLQIEPEIFDLDRHVIPARKTDPEHFHYDVRFVVRCLGAEQFVVSEESNALAWRLIDEIADDETMDSSVRRMAGKWVKRVKRLALIACDQSR